MSQLVESLGKFAKKVEERNRETEGKLSFTDDRHHYRRKKDGTIKKENIDWEASDEVGRVDKRCSFLPTSGRMLSGAVGRNIAQIFYEVTRKFHLTRISPFNLNHAHMFFTKDYEIAFLFHAQDDQVKQIRQNIIKQAQMPVIKKEMKYGLMGYLPPPNHKVLTQILPNPRRPGMGSAQNIKSAYVAHPAGIGLEVNVSGEGCHRCSAPEDKGLYLAHRNIYWRNGKFKLIKGKPPYYTVAPEEFTEHNWVADIVFNGLRPPIILYRPVMALSLAGMS